VPGKGWNYSDTNYIVAGMITERVTGHPYGDEIRQRIIEPLGDLNRFFTALLRGKLLPKQQLDEMMTTVPMDEEHPDVRYGLGLRQSKASCGKEVWAHGGDFHGTFAVAVTTRDGSHAPAFNFNGDWAGDIDAVVDAEFCGK
jgi:D-alanyl-D-alanine carboxypeptidase